MFNTILVPTDGSELADNAIHAAVEIAKSMHGKIIGLAVAEPFPYSSLADSGIIPDPAAHDNGLLERAQTHVDKIKAAAEQAGVPCETFVSLAADPATEIIDSAARHRCDVVFMASHGRRGIQKLLLGSVTQKVMAHSTLPVLVFR
jgi:nucleotide-binding universal stress UspA family protein